MNKCSYTHRINVHICTRGGDLKKKTVVKEIIEEKALWKIWKVEITCRNSCPLECKSMKIIYTKRSVACLDYRTNLLYTANIKKEEQKMVKNQVHISTIHCTMFM